MRKPGWSNASSPVNFQGPWPSTIIRFVIAIRRSAAQVLLFLVVLTPKVLAQQDGTVPKGAPKPRRIFTNDGVIQEGPERDNKVPSIPGLIKCGKDLQCFMQALDKTIPAAVTRVEVVEVGTAVVTSNSTWWTSQFADGRCTIEFRLDDLDARVNEKIIPEESKAVRDAAEQKLVEMKQDFEDVRGKTQTCYLAIMDVKAMMTPSSWSLMSLGPASNFGKNCSGSMFNAPGGPPEKQKE